MTRSIIIVLLSLGITNPLFSQDYIESYSLFDTPNGLQPLQCWYGVGQSPDGMVYVAGSDHVTNSALYQFNPKTKLLKFCGDAVSAAQAADNLEPGEAFEKFHCRPVYMDGKVYVASTEYSNFDDGYLSTRGFHWFAYDVAADTFIDVSAIEENGIAAAHAQAVQIVADTARKKIYAMGLPTAHIYELDVNTGLTKDYGRPPFDFPDDYPALATYPWIGSDGRLYFNLDHMSLDSIYNHIYYLDRDSGYGVMSDWNVTVGRWNPSAFTQHGTPWRLKIGAWTKDKERCYIATNFGDIHVYDATQHTWNFVGTLDWGDNWDYYSYQVYTRTMHLNDDESKLYFINDKRGITPGYFIIEFDLATKTSKILAKLNDLGSEFNGCNVHGGNDIWDEDGYFYFVSFGGGDNVLLSRFNPEMYKQTTNVENSYTLANITTLQLGQNHPNPFDIETTIPYYLPRSGNVVLKIYNLSGQEIETLVNGYETAGEHGITWRPKGLAGGIFYYRLQAEDPSANAGQVFSETKKLIFQK